MDNDGYDEECYDLAANFLEEDRDVEDSELNRRDLARTIQKAIEDWLEEHS